MIGFLNGKIHSKQPPFLWLDVNGVGYEIEAPMSTFYALPPVSEQTTLYIHTHVREDALLLFGFATLEEKSLYKTLIKVNGVGAKMALAILSAMSVAEFVNLVEAADSVGLTRIPGVGKKTGERLVIEMRDRLKELQGISATVHQASLVQSAQPNSAAAQQSAVDALIALGYKSNQAEKMIADVVKAQSGLTLEQMIKAALQQVKI